MNPPPVPDPTKGAVEGAKVAIAQQDMNKDAGVFSQAGSMVNQANPFGSLNYTQSGTGANGAPLYTATTTMTPENQALFNTLMGTKSLAGEAGGKLLGGANYGNMSPDDAIGDMTKGRTKDLLKTQTDYYQPFFTTQRDQLDTKLRNQGLAPGMPVYDNAMRSMDTSQNLTMTKAAGDFQNQAFEQSKYLYNLPAMLGENLAQFGAPGDPKAGFGPTPALNVQPANLIGAVSGQQGAQQAQYDAEMKQHQAMMSGLFGIPTAVLGGWGKAGMPGMGSMFGAGSSLGAGEAAGIGAGVDASLAGMGEMAALLAV